MQNNVLSPEQFLELLEQHFASLTYIERRRQIAHGRAWATVHYNGEVPPDLTRRFSILEDRCLC